MRTAALRLLPLAAGLAPTLGLPAGRGALQVAFALAVLASFVLISKEFRVKAASTMRRSGWAWASAIAGLGLLASVPGSQDPVASLGVVAQSMAVALGSWALAIALRQGAMADRALVFLRWGTAAALVVAVAGLLIWAPIAGVFRGELDLVEASAPLKPHVSVAALLLPVLALSLVRFDKKIILTGLALALTAVCVLVVETAARSALAGLLGMAGAVLLALSLRHRRWLWAWLALPLGLLPSLWWLSTRMPLASTEALQTWAPVWLIDAHRQAIWAFVGARFFERPWLGWGPNTINHVPGAQDPVPGLTVSTVAEFVPSHPHNAALEVLSEAGIIGGLPLLLLALAAVVALLRRYARGGDPAVLAALAVLAGYLSAGSFNVSFWALWWQMATAGLLALCAAKMRP